VSGRNFSIQGAFWMLPPAQWRGGIEVSQEVTTYA